MNSSDIVLQYRKVSTYEAACRGDVNVVAENMYAGLCVNEVYKHKDTLLHIACREGNVAQFDVQFEYQVDYLARNCIEEDSFTLVCKHGHQVQLQKQLQVNRKPMHGHSQLLLCVLHEHVAQVDYILEHSVFGIDCLSVDILNLAVKKGNLSILSSILRADLTHDKVYKSMLILYIFNSVQCMQRDVSIQLLEMYRRYTPCSAIFESIQSGTTSEIVYTGEHIVDPISPVFVACVIGDGCKLTWLLQQGYSISARNSSICSQNCVYTACLQNHGNILQILQKQKETNVLLLQPPHSMPCSLYASQKYQLYNTYCVQLSHVPDDTKQKQIITALQDAVKHNDIQNTALLFSLGRNALHTVEYNQHPLTIACFHGHKQIVHFFLDQGISKRDVESQHHHSLQQVVAMKGYTDMFTLLARD